MTEAAAAAAPAPQVDEPNTVSVHVEGPGAKDAIVLEHVSPLDTVMTLRQMIAEFPVLAHHTCYHLELQIPDDQWYAQCSDLQDG